jgi:hypothetical protein
MSGRGPRTGAWERLVVPLLACALLLGLFVFRPGTFGAAETRVQCAPCVQSPAAAQVANARASDEGAVNAAATSSGDALSKAPPATPACPRTECAPCVHSAPAAQAAVSRASEDGTGVALLRVPPLSPTCPRVLIAGVEENAIGSRFLALVVAVADANETQSSLVVDESFFGSIPGYGWVRSFVGLQRSGVLRTVPTLSRVSGPTVFERREGWLASLQRINCFRTVKAKTGSTAWRQSGNWFRRARPFFEAWRAMPHRTHAGALRCVWYLDTWDRLSSEALLRVASALPKGAWHRVLSDRPLCVEGTESNYCAFVKGLQNAEFSYIAGELECMRQMTEADVLVSGGSSFAAMAAELSSSSQLVLSFPGEGNFDLFDRGDVVRVSASGEVSDPKRVSEKIEALIGKVETNAPPVAVDYCSLFTPGQRPCFPGLSDRYSPLEFRYACDFMFRFSDQFPGKEHFPESKIFSPAAFNAFKNPVLFVTTTAMRKFISVLPRIQVKFVLVVGDSDEANPGTLSQAQVDAIIGNPNVVHWFGMNCDRIPDARKFTCLPLGNGMWNQQRESLQSAVEKGIGLIDGYKAAANPAKSLTALILFRPHDGVRRELWNDACVPGGVLASLNVTCFKEGAATGEAYYASLAQAKFVFSPFGMGLDTYRVWETLWMDSYPIVVSHPAMDTMYTDLPVLIVSKYRDLTPALLESTYQKFRARKDWRFDKLFIRYWRRQFDSKFQ